jgi:hypothetical protein
LAKCSLTCQTDAMVCPRAEGNKGENLK